jgi:outer membrane protein, multidrug efflux system
MKEKTIHILKIAVSALLLATFLLGGCTFVRRKEMQPPVELADSFTSTGVVPLPEKWWESLNDPRLNGLIERALGNNFSIRSAWDRLTQAEQIAIKSGAKLLPDLNYRAEARRTRTESEGAGSTSTNYSLGLIASYEVDLWGRVRSSRQAALLDAESARENVAAAAITLSANIAKTWYQLAEAKQQKAVINRQLETNQKVLDVITLQFRRGKTGAPDVFRQRQLVESSRGQLIKTREAIVLLQHQLSVLLGKTPGQWWSEETIDLISLSALPQVQVPSITLQQRPDVISAYKAVQAADLRVASAIADQYPSISIVATAETSASDVGDLFDDWLANLAANILGPIFSGGSRKAEIDRSRAILSQSLNDYGQKILLAIKEVEDAINQEYYQRQYVESLQQQFELAGQVYDRTRQSYIKGKLDYIRVLESLISRQTLERNELTARKILIERRIDLCRSIAGSWKLKRPQQAELIQQ